MVRYDSLLDCLRFLVPASFPVERCHILKTSGHIGMVGAEGPLLDRQRALEESLGLRVLALGVVQPREVAQAPGHIGVIRAESLLIDRQRAPEELLGVHETGIAAV